ncbi:MAG: L-threonylcarbamoyladenylate synthase [Candidatus Methylomirabilales bacterium]
MSDSRFERGRKASRGGRRTPRILSVNPRNPDPHVVRDIVNVLQEEGLVALPTDTVYGLAADISRAATLDRLLYVKARPHDKPIPIFIANIDALGGVAQEIPEAARQLAEHFWPGPLTLILYASPAVPEMITAGTGTVGVRIPQLPLIEGILAGLQRPITGTSANRSGGVDPVTAEDVLRAVGNQCDLLVDGGRVPGGIPSTVLDCTQSPFRIIREGAVGGEAIAALLGEKAPPS